MTDRRLRRLAFVVLTFGVAVMAAALVFVTFLTPVAVPPQYRQKPTSTLLIAATLIFAAVGAMFARKRPRNPIGWMLPAKLDSHPTAMAVAG